MAQTENDKVFAELEAKHGECARLDFEGKLYAWRALTQDEFEEYRRRASKEGADIPVLNRELAQTSLVHPSLEEAQKFFQRKPIIPAKVSDKLAQMAGAEIEFTTKKD